MIQRMRRTPRLLLLLALWLALWAGLLPLTGVQAQAQAQTAAAAAGAAGQADAPADINTLRAQLTALPKSAETSDEARLLVRQVDAIGIAAQKLIDLRTGQLNDLNARLGELGPAPAAGTTEDPDVTRQRTALTRERNGVDADIRLARLVVVDAQQRATELLNKRRQDFEARLTERTASPLSPAFWRGLADAWPDDRDRLRPLLTELRTAVSAALMPGQRGVVLSALLLALLIITLGNMLAERALVALAQRLLPGGRLRRSLLVIAVVFVNMLLVALALHGLRGLMEDRQLLGEAARELVKELIGVALFMTFVLSLGRALLANARRSWRLPPIADTMAMRLRPFPLLVAIVGALVWIPAQVNALVEASYAALQATQAATAAALTLLVATLMFRLRPAATGGTSGGVQDAATVVDTTAGNGGTPAQTVRPVWVGLLRGLVGVVLLTVVGLLASGYVALASLVASQLIWTGIVGCAFYVLFKFVDDLCMALLAARSATGQRLAASFGLQPTRLDQAAVLLSGVLRLALFFYLIVTLMAPLGTGPEEVVQRSGQLGSGLQVGEFQFVPAALFSALAVLVAGFVALRVLRVWLDTRYFPASGLEPGMRSSLTTLLGYAGGVLVVAMALSALGIGINRIAWIASALSVGIGFGLQAIVQNFISGLILLAERPVKVGDWVVLGTTEGDVRRINVRATEIQLADRSTVIVPNSEFITKTVRNMTLANAEGRVLIRLPMPLASDARHVRDLMLAACAAHPSILPTPAPSVSLEGIENGMLIFQAIAYVNSPRVAGGVKSDLLFTMLEDFKQAGLPLVTPVVTATPPAPAPLA
ncbi:DUF3772 domain-containing protein [Pseudacidovorax sp. RU35E]|uniref:DUF3772 domain-containing protein n=1 Tax=Pseudacidovorax sp. RU35E TaxID=1907403 RepID=UPI0009555E0E|nr:Small-conductance mechanosensitive channel [Pseudacidovorax sp. RU35E]